MTLDRFLKLQEKEQIDFLANDISSLEDFVLFVSLARMLHRCLSYNVLRRSMDIWEARLNTETRTMTPSDREQFSKLLGLAIEMKFVGSFAEVYEIDSKLVMARKQQLSSPTTKQQRRRTLMSKSRDERSGFMVDLPIC
jgi:hypothetical protein